MATKASIDISDHDSNCTMYYTVSYRLSGSGPGWQYTGRQYNSPVILSNLDSGVAYDYEIVRTCCTGGNSTPLTGSFTPDVIPDPPNFLANQDGADVDLTWDAVSGADGYEIQRADDVNFTTNVIEIYNGSGTSTTDIGPDAGTYWYRIRTLDGGLGSAWNSLSITVS